MRIISGKARGIRLVAPEGDSLRPTEDRVKESLFGTLGDLTDKVVVDLFAGSGALGLEALSRGAAKVLLVEKNPRHIPYVEKNLCAVEKSMGIAPGRARILPCDVRQAHVQLAELLKDGVDVVLADPPYHGTAANPYCGEELLRDAAFAAWAKAPVLLCLEHGSDTLMPWAPDSAWELIREKSFGIRALSFARRIRE